MPSPLSLPPSPQSFLGERERKLSPVFIFSYKHPQQQIRTQQNPTLLRRPPRPPRPSPTFIHARTSPATPDTPTDSFTSIGGSQATSTLATLRLFSHNRRPQTINPLGSRGQPRQQCRQTPRVASRPSIHPSVHTYSACANLLRLRAMRIGLSSVQSREKVLVRGCENFLLALT